MPGIPAPAGALEILAQINTSIENVPYTLVGPTGYGYVTTHAAGFNAVADVSQWIADVQATLVTSHDNSVLNILAMTQDDYDELEEVDAQTLYVIVPEA